MSFATVWGSTAQLLSELDKTAGCGQVFFPEISHSSRSLN